VAITQLTAENNPDGPYVIDGSVNVTVK
jgi:hypothetical protein